MRKSGEYIECRHCSKPFYVKRCHAGKKPFCSKNCYSQWQVGKNFPNAGQFKKGQESFNKGTVGLMKPNKTSFKCGENHQQFKGRMKHRGYIIVYSPNHPFKDSHNYVKEHRLIMEASIGRFLNPKEVVHHMNHIRDDNRIENLLLMKGKSEHQSLHNMLRKTC